ncbi:type II secretion system protein [Faecalicatena orotica]|uniref:type II secretion system protein n=1 Tax=Faecalicatena orotica TaxID=1544 RepID=UPI003216AF00
MVQKLKELRKNKKGFTLVELIVVLVILGILIALLVPSLTGYIKKADQKVVLAEARSAQMAVQTIASESYETNQTAGTDISAKLDEAKKLAEVNGEISDVTLDENNKVKSMTYTGTKYTIVMNDYVWDSDHITANSKVETD